MPSRLPFAVLAWLALALPFVFGYTRPPIANFWPWLAAWGCAWVVLAVAYEFRPDWAVQLDVLGNSGLMIQLNMPFQ